jgi:hypothetical protein
MVTALTAIKASKLATEIQETWTVVKIETTDPSLNTMTKDIDFSKWFVEFSKSGTVFLSGKDTKTKYSVKGDRLILSEGMIKGQSEMKADIKSGQLSVSLSAEVVKQILLTATEQYLKSGGDPLIAKMIESVATTYSIEAVITLKRK